MKTIRIHTFEIAHSKYSIASSFACFNNRIRPIKTKARTYSGSLSRASLQIQINAMHRQPQMKLKNKKFFFSKFSSLTLNKLKMKKQLTLVRELHFLYHYWIEMGQQAVNIQTIKESHSKRQSELNDVTRHIFSCSYSLTAVSSLGDISSIGILCHFSGEFRGLFSAEKASVGILSCIPGEGAVLEAPIFSIATF